MKPWSPLVVLAALLWPSVPARAGKNVWTNRHPRPWAADGYLVTCRAGVCRHRCPSFVHTAEGVRFETRATVLRVGKSWGVAVVVSATPADGKAHGLNPSLLLSGRVTQLPPRRWRISYGFGSGAGLSFNPPRLRPGQRRLMTNRYPFQLSNGGIAPGHRAHLTVRVAQLVQYHPLRSTQPKVAKVVLTVPYKGAPRIRYARP